MNERVDKEFEKLSLLKNINYRSNYVWIMQKNIKHNIDFYLSSTKSIVHNAYSIYV